MEEVDFKINIDDSRLKASIKENTESFAALGKSASVSQIAIDKAIGFSFKEQIAEAKKGIQSLEESLKEINKEIEGTAPGKEWANLATQKKEITQEMQREKAILTDLSAEQKKYESSTVSLRTQITNLRQQLSTLTEGTDEYRAVMTELGNVQDRYNDIQRQGRIMSDDYKYFKATREAVQGVIEAMSTGISVASLFGAKNEDLEKVQAKLQAVIAISIGVQQMATVVNKDSYFTHIILAKAKSLDATVTAFLSKMLVALKVSTVAANIAARVLLVTLTAGLIVGVWALVAAYAAWSKKQEENKQKMENLKKAQQAFNDTVAESASKAIVGLRLLQRAYAQVGDSMAAKSKFIKDNKKAFDDLGLSIQSVSDLENLLVNNTGAYVASMMAKAKAEAYADAAKEKIKEQIAMGNEVTYKVEYKVEYAPAHQGHVKQREERDDINTNKNKEKAIREHLDKRKQLEKEANDYTLKATEETEKMMLELKKGGFKKSQGEDKEHLKTQEGLTKRLLEFEKAAQAEALSNARKFESDKTKGTKEEIENRYKYTIDDIAKKEKEYIDAAVKAGVSKKAKDVVLPDVFNVLRDQAKSQQTYEFEVFDIEKSKEKLSDFEKLAEEYVSKYNELEELKKTASDEKKITGSGFSSEEISALISQQESQLAILSDSLKGGNESLQIFLSEVVSFGISATAKKLEELQIELSNQKKQGKGDASNVELQAKIKVLQQQLSIALSQLKSADKGADGNLDQWKSMQTLLLQVNKTIDDSIGAFDSLSDAAKVTAKAASDFVRMSLQMINGIVELANWSTRSIALTAQGASAAVITVEKASVVLAVISAALQITMKIIDLVKSNKAKEAARQTEIIENKIESLEKSYNNLQRSIAKAYGQDAANLIAQGNQLLEQQKQQLELLIAQEQAKAKSANKNKEREEADKASKQYQGQLDEINFKIEDNKEKRMDVIFGDDVKGAIDKLSDYYINSFGKSNAEIAKGQKDFVRKMVQGMITQMIQAAFSKDMERLRQVMSEAMLGGITKEEENLIDSIIDGMYSKADEKTKNLDKWLGDDSSADGRQTEAKGIARASQESVDENNALLVTMVGHTRELLDGQKDMLNFALLILNDIQDTFALIKSIKEDTRAIKKGIEDIRDNGIIIKR